LLNNYKPGFAGLPDRLTGVMQAASDETFEIVKSVTG